MDSFRNSGPEHDLHTDLMYEGRNTDSSGWTVPWSDLMMVMFVLFVVLFIYSSSTKNAAVLFAGGDKAESAEESGLFSPIEGLIDRISGHAATVGKTRVDMYEKAREIIFDSKADGVSVIMEADGSVRMTMRGDIFFNDGKADLDPRSKDFLMEAASLISMNRNMVHVIGHCDSEETGGRGTDGLRLSALRAAATAGFLVNEGKIAARRFIVSGQGPFRPEVPAVSPEATMKNRRVEIVILTDLLPENRSGGVVNE